jgi:hypothetical protein
MLDDGTRIGRPPEFTSEQIIVAGERIRARNQSVTGFRLRTEIGGGKPSRLFEVWTRHENELIDASAKKAIEDLPFELVPHAEAVSDLAATEAKRSIQNLYRTIYSEINARLNAQFKAELENAKDTADSAQIEIGLSDERLEAAKAAIERLTSDNQRLAELNARLEERATQLERAVEAARAEARQAHLDAIELVASARSDAAAEKARIVAKKDEEPAKRPARTKG